MGGSHFRMTGFQPFFTPSTNMACVRQKATKVVQSLHRWMSSLIKDDEDGLLEGEETGLIEGDEDG
jgi:hypothetical protein